MYTECEDIKEPVQFCINIILKEARLEDRLVRQLFYVMASAYTNNPLNLAINSPSGEGKNWVIKRVAEKFPQEDVMRLSGMTAKSIFHKRGINVVKNEDAGKYEPLDDRLAEIDSQIWEIEQEILRTNDKDTRHALKGSIKNLEHDKSELWSKSKKLIDLSHKILIFLDTPPAELLSALMSLVAHDEYETEYEYVDTHNGIKTKTNVLRGYPVFIFAQAADLGNYRRYTEIQRRFIFTNPRMDSSKYEAAIDLIVDSFGLPEFVYQAKILEQKDVDKCKGLILQMRSKMLEMISKVRPDKYQKVFVPFGDAIKSSVPKTKGFDMTTGNRLMSFLSLLPIINIDRRPRLVTLSPAEKVPVEVTPIALFEDLQESISIMENSSGLRPYQLEWYQKVFLSEYSEKTEPDSRMIKNQQVTEKTIAVTTEQLAKKTKEVCNHHITSKKILETYLDPLLNEGYIDRTSSDLDGRAYIYYPIVDMIKPFDYSIRDESNNISHQPKIIVRNTAIYPDKPHIISKIQEIEKYSIEQGFQTIIRDPSWNDMTADELTDQHYNNPEDYFDYTPDIPDKKGNSHSSNCCCYPYLITRKHIFGNPIQTEYFQNDEITSESQGKNEDNIKSTRPEDITQDILCDSPHIEQSNTFTGSSYDHLIVQEYLPNLNQTVYRCKEHPDIWYIGMDGLKNHSKTLHTNKGNKSE